MSSKMELPLQSIFMFNSWPAVSINRNDSEIQMFSKYFATVQKNEILRQMTNNYDEEEPKSRSVATTFRIKGNNLYKMLEYTSALEMYNTSICRAPRDSSEFGLAVANRSAVLFDMKKYKECMEDIDLVLRSEYPKNLLYKVFLRQSKCYLELFLVTEAEESLKKAEEAFNNEQKSLSQVIIAMVNESIKTLKTEIKEQKEKPLCIEEAKKLFPSPTLRNGENSIFLNASNDIIVKHISSVERGVFATSDIKKGDVLFIEKPYAMVAETRPEEKRFNLCSFCLQTSLNCIPCTTCTTNFYCSSKCQLSAWNLSHKWECVSERRQIITDSRQKLSLAILLKASHDGFKTEVEDASRYGNKENNHPFMNKLLTHKNKIPKYVLGYNVKASVWLVTYLKSFTDYFDWLYVQPNRPAGTRDDLYNFVGGHLVKYLLQIGCNMDVIQEGLVHIEADKSASIGYTAFGLGIYLSSAMINHSCLPNAAINFQESTKVVRALKDIPTGSEIKINYLKGNDDKETNERQSQLEKYVFKCSCDACTNPKYEELFDPLLCPRCHGKAYPFRGKKLAKCIQCSLVFNRREHTRNEHKIAQMLLVFQLTGEFSHKEVLYNLMKKTYHKDNVLFIGYHHACLKTYEKTGDIKKTIDTIKELANISKCNYGDTSKEYLISVIQSTYSLVEYSNILRKDNSPLYQSFVTEAKEYMQKSVASLQYYICPKNIDIFVKNITESINSGEIKEHVEAEEHECMLENLAQLYAFLR